MRIKRYKNVKIQMYQLEMDRSHQATWDKFLKNVHITDGCWYWTGAQSISSSDGSKRYGCFSVPGEKSLQYAHRVSYALHKGPIPFGKFVLHICDNELCVNPDHLLLGTALDNSRDAVKKNRIRNCERHGAAKLTNKQVHHIKKIGDDFTRTHLAAMFHVSISTISAIMTGRTWTKLPVEDSNE